MNKTTSRRLVSIAMALTTPFAIAYPALNADGYIDGESIRLDPATGDYVITYFDGYGPDADPNRFVTVVYDVPNKIRPEIRTSVTAAKGRDITYRYEVLNGKGARQDIYAFSFNTLVPWFEEHGARARAAAASALQTGDLAGVARAIESNTTYVEQVEAQRMRQSERWLPEFLLAKGGKAFAIRWQAHPNRQPRDNIRPNQRRGGFGLDVPYLPGLVKVGFAGDSKPLAFPGGFGGDSKIWKDIDDLMFGTKAPAPKAYSLGPRVLIPEPFSTKALAQAIAGDLPRWVETGQLSQPLAQRLTGLLLAAGDAAERNNTPGVTANATEVFRELFMRHAGMSHRNAGEDDPESARRRDHAELSYLAARAIVFNTFELVRRYFSARPMVSR